MTPEAQRIAIAEFCGIPAGQVSAWLEQVKATSDYQNAVPGGADAYTQKVLRASDMSPPDYLNDLNAMHEALLKLNREQKHRYVHALIDICDPETFTSFWDNRNPLGLFRINTATAAQRAESLLRTIAKWDDSK